MTRKLCAAGLLLGVCSGLFAVQASSQDRDKFAAPPLAVPADVPLEQSLQELRNVRAQRAELDKREKQLVELIARKIQGERQQLDQKVQERRQQLDRMEAELRPHARRDGAKEMKTGEQRVSPREDKKDEKRAP